MSNRSEWISVYEAAKKWGLTERSVSGMCVSEKIEGAYKEGKSWRIPADAVRPADGREHTGAYKQEARKQKLPLPVGISDFRTASTEYYYVDKTMLIKDFIDERPKVSLFTRPRRFGKTLNMDMLRVFFEASTEDTSVYFRDKKIWKQGKRYQEYQGKYPVVFVSFKDVKCESWEDTLEKLSEIIGVEFARHKELQESAECDEQDKAVFRRILERKAGHVELSAAFSTLTRMLHQHYKIPAVIIIDEYDTPIHQGHTQNFYGQTILFMRNLFSGGFKDNSHLAFGFMTGILRVAKESIFSGLNNIILNSVLDEKYSEYFGFTDDEVRAMAEYYGAEDAIGTLREWYDGYRFGNAEIYNPWSVVNFFRNGARPGPYWQSTGGNEIIGEVLAEAGADIYENLQTLLQGGSVTVCVDTNVIYPEIGGDPSSVYSFLLVAGYLKAEKCDAAVMGEYPGEYLGEYMCEVALPNKEISLVYKKEILDQFSGFVPRGMAPAMQEALYTGNAEKLQQLLGRFLLDSVSYFDTASESFYHGLLLGLLAMLDSRYSIRSNRESGEGRFDIQLLPRPGKSGRLPGIIIELKAAGRSRGRAGNGAVNTVAGDVVNDAANDAANDVANDDPSRLQALAASALDQIRRGQYDAELRASGVDSITCFGVAFSGKNVEIASGRLGG